MSPFVYLTRTETFSAAHRLHSASLSKDDNEAIYGKCNNPNGHGHNYKDLNRRAVPAVTEVDVTIKGKVDPKTGMVFNISDLKSIIEKTVMESLDHKNLDKDVPFFKENISTTENLCVFIWQLVSQQLPKGMLHCIKVHETDKNVVKFYGDFND